MKRLVPFLFTLVLLLTAACGSPQVNTGTPAPSIDTTQTGETQPAEPLPAKTEPPVNQPGMTEVDTFSRQLADALEAKDYETLQGMMGERFSLAGWRSEGRDLSTTEAMTELQQTALAPGAMPVATFGADLPALLEGSDPLQIFGPQANAQRAFYLVGLGPNAADEGIAIVSRDPASGRYVWYGLLVAMQGFWTDATPSPGPDEAFDQQLGQAIESRDFTMLRSLMRDRFLVATWNTSLEEISAGDAMRQISEHFLAEGSQPAVIWGTDITALLEGVDPLSLWGPVANPLRAMHVMGLGPDANEEAVFVIGRDATTGEEFWLGILVPPAGYFTAATPPPGTEPGAVVDTDVEYIRTKTDVNLRSGPGLDYAVEGLLSAGMTAKVDGKSADGQWWRVVCEQDSSGYCWMSADPDLTEPASAP